MAGKTNYLENAVINHFLKGTAAVAQPTNLYLALFTSATVLDLEAGTGGTEVSGGSYARQLITFSAAASGATANSADVLFPVATANYGTVRYFGVYDALTVGNPLYLGQFTADKVINTDDQLKVAAGQLTITED